MLRVFAVIQTKMTATYSQPGKQYWRRLPILPRVCCILLPLFLVVWAQSYWHFNAFTTQDRRDTFLDVQGCLIWKHRSAPRADFQNAIGIRGFDVFGTGALFVQTPGSQHMWYFSVRTLLLVLLTAIPPAISIFRLRLADRRGFTVSPVRPSEGAKA